MTLTVTGKSNKFRNGQRILDHVSSPLKAYTVDVTFDSSYATGGETLDTDTIGKGFNEIIAITPQISADAVNYGYIVAYDRTNSKLKAFYCDSDYASERPLKEVPNGTDLSGVTVTLVILGY